MPWKQEYGSGKYAGLVISLLFFFTVFSLSSEEISGRIILEKTNFVVGEEFSLSILVPGAAPLMLTVETPTIPGGIRLLKGPYMRPGQSGTIVDYYFRVEKPGRYVLGSFSLRTALEKGFTPPVFIKAGKNDFQLSGIDNVPPNIKWAVPRKTYYPGEIIPMMFVVEHLENDDINLESSIYSNNSGIVSRISRKGEKEEKTVLSKNILTGNIYDILYHNHIFIPVFPGTIPLPGAEVFISRDGKSHSTYLPEKKITITPVPYRIKDTRAIGDLGSGYTVSNYILHSDEIIVVNRVIEGTGNFYAMNIPSPYTDKPELVEITKLKENLSAVPSGQWFKGSLSVRFSIKQKKNVKKDIDELINVTIPDMTVMRMRDDFENSWRYDFYTLEGGNEEIKITSEKRQYTGISANTEIPSDSDISIIMISIISTGLMMFSAVLVFGLKNKNRFIIIVAFIFIIVLAVLTAAYIFKEKEDYGIISSNPEIAGIYTVPDENSSIKYSASSIKDNLKVRVKGSTKDYYLIEMPDGGEGWIKKDDIRLDNE